MEITIRCNGSFGLPYGQLKTLTIPKGLSLTPFSFLTVFFARISLLLESIAYPVGVLQLGVAFHRLLRRDHVENVAAVDVAHSLRDDGVANLPDEHLAEAAKAVRNSLRCPRKNGTNGKKQEKSKEHRNNPTFPNKTNCSIESE